jgi:hypothetical protein
MTSLLILAVGTGTAGKHSDVAQGLAHTIRLVRPRKFWLVPSASERSLGGHRYPPPQCAKLEIPIWYLKFLQGTGGIPLPLRTNIAPRFLTPFTASWVGGRFPH